ncbi:MAG TPA: HAD hydrolase-like protein, partial [Draconibacterium sp.]|nr:HAD hydrolase-like protein [Draconibacterium sp.]
MQKLDINPQAKGLIFDLDGTLADTMPVHFNAYQNILGKYGVDYSARMFLELAGVPAVETIERINEVYGVKLHPKEVGFEKEAEYERMMHKIKPIQPVVDLVKKYHGKLPMAVGTGGYRHLAQKTLEFIGLSDYIDIVVTANDVSNFK